jgi:phosphatidylserine decarboxylase
MSHTEFRPPEQTKGLRRLYCTRSGRFVLRALIRPGLSRVAGKILDSKISRRYIPRFVKKNGIDLSEAQEREYCSFNDFFTRLLKEGARTIEMDPNVLISPCDSRLSVFPIEESSVFSIKDSHYTVESLLQDESLRKRYDGGVCAIFRLTVSDYHRYCYFDNGTKEKNCFIPGKLHTVNPISSDRYPVYKTNSREYTLLHTENFGDVVQMEVGALLVGRIVNYHQEHTFSRGEEKGRFEFGGSTIVLLFEKDSVRFPEEVYRYSREGYEKIVKMGEKIGEKV